MPAISRFRTLLFGRSARPARGELRIAVGLALSVLMTQSSLSQTREEPAPSATGLYGSLLLEPPTQSVGAFSRASLGGGGKLEYLGTFCANAQYKKSSKLTQALEAQSAISESTSVLGETAARQTGAPPWMILPAREVVEDFAPPAHATKIAQPQSNLASIRDKVVTFVYGRARVMGAPHQVTTDSMLRVIISDPELRAVHVFDPKGKTSFSIPGGQGRRLHVPAGVAVDAEDNIYIADSEAGMVLVYNQYGQFVRYIGNIHGENMYERPTGIAIDRKAGRLYVADTPRNLVFVLDLQGNVLKRLGKDRHGHGSGEFLSPTQIAVSDHGIVVLDAQGSRIHVLDSDGDNIRCYHLVVDPHPGVDRDNGLSVDPEGNIYISYVARSIIGAYKPDGTPMGTFGQPGSRIGEFLAPKGLWVDANNRIYVSDTANARVQVFEVTTTATSPHVISQHGRDRDGRESMRP
jgi:DNA-binding beta-propeller fold protein YncE